MLRQTKFEEFVRTGGPGGRLGTLTGFSAWRQPKGGMRFEIDTCCLRADLSRPCSLHVCKSVSNVAVILSREVHIEV